MKWQPNATIFLRKLNFNRCFAENQPVLRVICVQYKWNCKYVFVQASSTYKHIRINNWVYIFFIFPSGRDGPLLNYYISCHISFRFCVKNHSRKYFIHLFQWNVLIFDCFYAFFQLIFFSVRKFIIVFVQMWKRSCCSFVIRCWLECIVCMHNMYAAIAYKPL